MPDQTPVFHFDFSVPRDSDAVDDFKERTATWLEQLARQLTEEDIVSVEITGLYVDDPYDDGGNTDRDQEGGGDASGSSGVPGAMTWMAAQQKAAVNIMICAGKRPYT